MQRAPLPVNNMRDIAIYGAGGFGRETALLIRQINELSQSWRLIGYFDDSKIVKGDVDGVRVVGNLSDLNNYRESLSLCVAVANPLIRRALIGKITNSNLDFPILIHPGSQTGDKNNVVGKGCIITAGSILTTKIDLGDFVIVNLASTIGHDSDIGNFSSIMPGCSISGNVSLGKACLMGTGARVLQNISIGDESVIGAGAVVTKSFGNKVKLLGIPAVNVQPYVG